MKNNVKLYKRDCRKLSSNRVRRKHIKPELVYYDIRYTCTHGGRPSRKKKQDCSHVGLVDQITQAVICINAESLAFCVSSFVLVF